MAGYTAALDFTSIAEIILRWDWRSPWERLVLQLLLTACTQLDVAGWLEVNPLGSEFVAKLARLAALCPTERSTHIWELEYRRTWELLATLRQRMTMIHPTLQRDPLPGDAFLAPLPSDDDGITGYTLPISSY